MLLVDAVDILSDVSAFSVAFLSVPPSNFPAKAEEISRFVSVGCCVYGIKKTRTHRANHREMSPTLVVWPTHNSLGYICFPSLARKLLHKSRSCVNI